MLSLLSGHKLAVNLSLEAMFPEHWERGTGTWNAEHHFVKPPRNVSIHIPYVPNIVGTRSKCFRNDVPGTMHDVWLLNEKKGKT
jgi:hypothetical protein